MSDTAQFAKMMELLEKVRAAVHQIELKLTARPEAKEVRSAISALSLVQADMVVVKADLAIVKVQIQALQAAERASATAAAASTASSAVKWSITGKTAERVGVALLGAAFVALAWVVSMAIG